MKRLPAVTPRQQAAAAAAARAALERQAAAIDLEVKDEKVQEELEKAVQKIEASFGMVPCCGASACAGSSAPLGPAGGAVGVGSGRRVAFHLDPVGPVGCEGPERSADFGSDDGALCTLTPALLRSCGVAEASLKRLRDLGALQDEDEPKKFRPDDYKHLKTIKVRFSVDSGAAVSAQKLNECKNHKLHPNDVSRRGGGYRSATGEFVRDMGSRRLVGFWRSRKGNIVRGITVRAAQVARNLLAVSELTKLGFDVHFSEDVSYMVHRRTGEEFEFEEKNGTYELEVEVFSEADAARIQADYERHFQGRGQSGP